MKKILRVSSILGIATVVKICAGLFRAKFLAWQIGPEGVGLVGQALMYSVLTVQLCSLNMGMGIIKNVSGALSEKKMNRIPLVVNTAATLQWIAAGVFIVLVLPFSRSLARFLFSSDRYWVYFAGITLATPLAIFFAGMADPILYSFRKIPEYTRLMIIYTLIGLSLVFVFVPLLKTEGMFLQIIMISLAGFFISYRFIGKKISVAPRVYTRIFRDRQSRIMSFRLFQYGFISFLPAIISMCVLLYLRSVLIRQFGAVSNGYYQVAYAMSAYYLPFVMNGIWGHFYPEMCAINTRRDINREVNQFIRFALFASTIIAAGLIIFRKAIILFLYSKAFMGAYDLLAIQAVGDIFFVLFCMFSVSLMARRKFKEVFFMSAIGYNALILISFYLFANLFGYRSLNMAVAAANILLVAVFMAYYRADTGFLLIKKNTLLFIKSAILLTLLFLFPDTRIWALSAKVLMSCVWLILAVTKDEAKGFIDLILSGFKKTA